MKVLFYYKLITFNFTYGGENMNTKELRDLVNEGKNPVIKFNSKAEKDFDESVDPNMFGRITGVGEEYGECFIIVDLNDFEEHNRSVALPNWYDSDSNPRLTWFESGMYPRNGIVKLYLYSNEDLPFDIVEQNGLTKEYLDTKSSKSYVEWLEHQIIKLRESK